MTKQENPNFKASRFAPNPQEVAYWIDLTADPNGGIIKTYDGTEWYPINQSEVNIPVVSEDANGLMSSDMLVKLNGIEDNANKLYSSSCYYRSDRRSKESRKSRQPSN